VSPLEKWRAWYDAVMQRREQLQPESAARAGTLAMLQGSIDAAR
jgi:hypothetical protein